MVEDYSKLDAFLDMYYQIVLINVNSDPYDNFCDGISCNECQIRYTRFCDAHNDAEKRVVEYFNKYRPELFL